MSGTRIVGVRMSVLLVSCLPLLLASAPPSASPVADAAMRDDTEAVRSLLKQGADVNAAHGDGMTALHWAAHNGDVLMAKMLIYAGANLEAVTRVGDSTPLHLASKAANTSVVATLLEAGSDASAATSTGTTPLHFAAASGGTEAVALLLGHGADVNAKESVWGQTPLMFAASRDRAETANALLQKGADATVTTAVVDIPARHEAMQAEQNLRKQRLAALRALTTKAEEKQTGEEQEGQEQAEEQEQAQAKEAQEQAKERQRQEQAEEPETQEQDEEQEPLLGRDVFGRETETLPGAEEEEVPAGQQAPRLSYAELVGDYGGLTALLYATREGHEETVRALVEADIDTNQVSAGDRTSPLLIAALNGHFDLAMLLLESGADPNLASDAGATPLYAALNLQWAPKSDYPHRPAHRQQQATYLDVMEALLKAGANPNARLTKHLWYMEYNFQHLGVDTKGATPFWRAAYATDIDAMRLLRAHGADTDVATQKVPQQRRYREGEKKEDLSGVPPVQLGGPAVYPIHAASGVGYGEGFAGNVHRHVPDGWLPAVKYLVEELDADVNARDLNGYTPVHHAAARGDSALIRYLVEQGADVTAVSRKGQTTADMANGPVQRVQPFLETVALLENLGAENNHNCLSC